MAPLPLPPSTPAPAARLPGRQNAPAGAAGQTFGFHVAGTVREWQDEIARPLKGCSNVALAAGTALAAPLLPFAGEQTGGFHISCRSTFGKTAALTVGESFYGRPTTTSATRDVEAFGSKWATASDVGIVGLAQKRTDLPLFLDEVGSAKSVKEKVVEIIYILTGGTPKLRADSQGNVRQQHGFSTLVFSTGEPPLRTFLSRVGDTEGRQKRLVDVPALVGVETALETIPHEKLGDVCGHIYTATDRLHGAVGQAWLRHLVDLGDARIKAKLDQHRAAWLALPDIAKLLYRDPKDDSVIRRFALLAAALRMAVEAELWPWSIEESDRGIVACTLRWAADRGLPVATLEEKAAEQKLREAIKAERAKFVVLEKHPGRGGGLLVPIPEQAIIYENPAAFKEAGTLYGFIKIDGENTRILAYPDAFHRLSTGCDRDALVAPASQWAAGDQERKSPRPDRAILRAR
jgi:putative DNA primase/helicase